MIRVILPAHLRTLARADSEIEIDIVGPVTQRSILDALEAGYPMLRGTIREYGTGRRREFLRVVRISRMKNPMPNCPMLWLQGKSRL